MALSHDRPPGVRTRSNRRAPRAAGFSLIELMVVIAIMGLLATVVAVKLTVGVDTAKITKVASDMDSIKKGIELYKLSVGRYPQRFDELWSPPSGNAAGRWKGPYLDDVPPTPRDPWGNDYVYTPPSGGSEYLIISYGEDGAPGGSGLAQDITNKTVRQILDGKSP